MKHFLRTLLLLLRLISLLLILGAFGLTAWQKQIFDETRDVLPAGSVAAGIPVGGVSLAEAAGRLQAAYSVPVELYYGGATIQLDPAEAGFHLDLGAMLPASFPASGTPGYWQEFREFLWGRTPAPIQVPLKAVVSPDELRAALETIAARYDHPAQPPYPVPASVDFHPGKSGQALDIDAALPKVRAAFFSLTDRQVDLPLQPLAPGRPSLQNLQTLLLQNIRVSGFEGLADIYFHDLASGQEIHFAYQQGITLTTPADIAFTASSIIKVPIMISVFRRLDGPPSQQVAGWLHEMIANSSNDAADALMKTILDEVRGPLLVSEDMQALGLQNTFLAGYFALGSPLLQRFQTPANELLEISTDPDPYNQTTPVDIGSLLEMIYTCAESGRGPLIESFSGQITPTECQEMVAYLESDRQPYLLTAGVPEGTPIAHKHGYGSTGDIINTIGDAGILYTPGGDYILVVYLNNPNLLLFDPANKLVATLSRAVYNNFNLPVPNS